MASPACSARVSSAARRAAPAPGWGVAPPRRFPLRSASPLGPGLVDVLRALGGIGEDDHAVGEDLQEATRDEDVLLHPVVAHHDLAGPERGEQGDVVRQHPQITGRSRREHEVGLLGEHTALRGDQLDVQLRHQRPLSGFAFFARAEGAGAFLAGVAAFLDPGLAAILCTGSSADFSTAGASVFSVAGVSVFSAAGFSVLSAAGFSLFSAAGVSVLSAAGFAVFSAAGVSVLSAAGLSLFSAARFSSGDFAVSSGGSASPVAGAAGFPSAPATPPSGSVPSSSRPLATAWSMVPTM